jgi:hypothetical protein
MNQRESGNFKDDDEVMEWFVEEMEPLWIKASDILWNILPRVYKDYSFTMVTRGSPPESRCLDGHGG